MVWATEPYCLLTVGTSQIHINWEVRVKSVFGQAWGRSLNNILRTWFFYIFQLARSSAHSWLYSRILCCVLWYLQARTILCCLRPFIPPIAVARRISSSRRLCLNHMPTLELGRRVTALPKLHRLKVEGLFLQSGIRVLFPEVRLKDAEKPKQQMSTEEGPHYEQNTISRKQLLSFSFLEDVAIVYSRIKLVYECPRKDPSPL